MPCKGCLYYVNTANNHPTQGDCRRDTPDAATPGGRGVWPIVNATDWCGEWESRRNGRPDDS